MTTSAVIEPVTGRTYATGWVYDPDAVAEVVASASIRSLSDAAPHLFGLVSEGANDAPVFFWDAEQKVLGKVLGSWNQGQVGSCVSFGYGRACQDLMLWEIMSGQPERWPDAEVATEPIYGGSRVEVGGGQLRGGDGSIGAWAAKWVRDWGVLIRTKYDVNGQIYDLSAYSENRARQYGDQGVPDPLEPVAKLHPVTDVAQVRSAEEVWAALGAGKPVPVCSMQGFTMTLNNGFCEPSGQWAHCMAFRGRFVHPTRGRCVVVQNSWGNYLRGSRSFQYLDANGQTKTGTLPEGCFCTTLQVAGRMAAQGDTFALAGFTGWEVTPPTPPEPPTPPTPPAPITGQVVIDLERKRVLLPVGWTAIPATLQRNRWTD